MDWAGETVSVVGEASASDSPQSTDPEAPTCSSGRRVHAEQRCGLGETWVRTEPTGQGNSGPEGISPDLRSGRQHNAQSTRQDEPHVGRHPLAQRSYETPQRMPAQSQRTIN